MNKKLKAVLVVMIVLLSLSHLPYINGRYGGSLPYHPFRLFSIDSSEIAYLRMSDGYGRVLTVDDREKIEYYCEKLNSFRYVLFIPDLLSARGQNSEVVNLAYRDDTFQYVYIRHYGFYRTHVGWYLGFGGGAKELIDTIALLR